jgi:hypothetical protein
MTQHTTQLLNRVNVDLVARSMSRKGFKLFMSDSKNYNLNIVGIRSSENVPDIFNDVLLLFWKFKGVWHERKYVVTTDPGLYYLNNPINVKGTAILKEQQVRGSHKLGLHRGRYQALTQVKPLTVIRDFDRDSNMDHNSGREETGYFGINIHNSGKRKSRIVNRWSAGCTVHEDPIAYKDFIQVCRNAKIIWGNSFTYTLLEESSL